MPEGPELCDRACRHGGLGLSAAGGRGVLGAGAGTARPGGASLSRGSRCDRQAPTRDGGSWDATRVHVCFRDTRARAAPVTASVLTEPHKHCFLPDGHGFADAHPARTGEGKERHVQRRPVSCGKRT